MTEKLSIQDVDVKNKRVLIRVDFNVPMDKSGTITDDTRIRASLPTIQYVLDHGGICILMSHLGRPKGKSKEFSLAPCAKRLSELLKKPVQMAPDCIGPDVKKMVDALNPGDILLLENVRFYDAEEQPEKDPKFAKELSTLADIYVNDAFGSAHRAHSSVATIAKYFPKASVSGFLLQKEIEFLGNAFQSPKRPFYAIIGGAKISTKIGILGSLLQKVDALFIGGAMAFTFFKASGLSIGNSPVEDSMLDSAKTIMNQCALKGVPLYLPSDVVIADKFANDAKRKVISAKEGIPEGFEGMDVGPETIESWTNLLQNGKTIFWNGPVGVFEFSNFAKGTQKLAESLGSLKNAIVIVGGGDSIAAIQQVNLSDNFAHLSTGGGASLEYIEKGTLPGIEVLTDK